MSEWTVFLSFYDIYFLSDPLFLLSPLFALPQAALWKGFAIRDGNLITGQQNFSGSEIAEALMLALGE
jgi:hypothetical protein